MKTRAFSAFRRRLAAISLVLLSNIAYAQTATLRETVVTASRTATRVDELLSDVTVIGRQDIERSGWSSLTELLAAVPGLQATPDSIRGANASVFVRGANNAQTLVLVDGQRVSSATTGATALQHLPLEQIERIEILRGPASSLYGSDAIGGVIQVFTRAASGAPAPSGSVSVGSHGTVAASAGYGGQAGDTRWRLQVGGESGRGFSDIRAAGGGLYDAFNPDRDGYRQRNLGLNLAHRASGNLELGASYLYTHGFKRSDGLNCDPSGVAGCTADFDNRDAHRLQSLALSAALKLTPDWRSILRVGLSQDALRSWLYDPGLQQENQERYTTAQRQLSWQNDVRVGPGLLMAALEWRGVRAQTTQDLVVSSQETSAASLGYQAWLGRHLVQASVRHDRIQRLGGSDTGTLGYGYKLADGWTVRTSAGTGFRAPSFNDLYWPLDLANYYQGNPQLRPERSRNLETGLAWESGEQRASLTVFRNQVRDLIQITTDLDTYISTMSNVSAATLKGASLQGRARWNDWTLAGAFDLLGAHDDASGRVLQRRVPRTATLDLARRLGAVDLGLRLQAYSHRYNDAANTQRLGGYALLGLRASWRLDPQWTLTGSLQNALDKDYVVNRGTFPPYNDYATAGRTLTVGLRYTGR